jgi:hypothetical protein
LRTVLPLSDVTRGGGGTGGPFGPITAEWLQRAGPQLTRDALLDRFETHTKHCRSCSSHLRRLKTIQAAALAGVRPPRETKASPPIPFS